MSQLFAFSVAAAIRATLLLLGAAGIAALLRRRPAAMLHAIWTAAMAASLAVPVLSATLPSLSIRSPVSVNVPVPALLPGVAKSARGTSPLFEIGAIFSSGQPAVSSGSRGKALLLVWLLGWFWVSRELFDPALPSGDCAGQRRESSTFASHPSGETSSAAHTRGRCCW